MYPKVERDPQYQIHFLEKFIDASLNRKFTNKITVYNYQH